MEDDDDAAVWDKGIGRDSTSGRKDEESLEYDAAADDAGIGRDPFIERAVAAAVEQRHNSSKRMS